MNVPFLLRQASRVYPRNVAIDHEDQLCTYRDLYARALRSAGALASLGVRKGDRVALLMLNSPEYLELYYSIAIAGAVVVPLNTRWNVSDITFALEDSETSLLFVDDRFQDVAREVHPRLPDLARVVHSGAEYETLLEAAHERDFDEPGENDLAGLFYTSGTTGGPKGAMLTHRNVISNALHAGIFAGAANSRWLHAAPMFHLADAGFLHSITLAGGCHSFVPAFEPAAVAQAVERYRITGMLLVPTMINILVHHPSLGRHDLSSLRRITYGASPMPLSLLRAAREKLGCDFAQGYGMTETSPLLTMLLPEDHCFEGVDRQFAPVKSAGRPVACAEVRVVDENDVELPPYEIGEVVARGPNIMAGYWKRPEISAEVLRGGWMHTGDLGAFDEDGFLYIYDRKKDMIKTGGENVYSPEVEALICSHPAVLEAAVIGVFHERWGETIRAVVAARSGSVLTCEELIAYCRERTSHFKCPTSVVFTDALPKGGTGKVLKNVLRTKFGQASSSMP